MWTKSGRRVTAPWVRPVLGGFYGPQRHGPRFGPTHDPVFPSRVMPQHAEGDRHLELELPLAGFEALRQGMKSTPAWCRPSINGSPRAEIPKRARAPELPKSSPEIAE